MRLRVPNEIVWLVIAATMVQACRAWAAHGAWIEAHGDALGPEIAARFAVGRGAREGEQARDVLRRVSEAAPSATLRLTASASRAGVPLVSQPLLRVEGLPVGLSPPRRPARARSSDDRRRLVRRGRRPLPVAVRRSAPTPLGPR